MTSWADLESDLNPSPAPGALLAMNNACDALAICDGWPRNTSKMSKAEAAEPRKNWRGVPPIYRLLASIQFAGQDDCWEWQRSRSMRGYGVLYVGRDELKATHLVLALEGSERPSPAHNALHSCDNPPCCNPKHLRWGTHRENSADMMARGRHNPSGLAVAHRRHRENPYCRSGRHLLAETAVRGSRWKRICDACQKERRRVRSS